MIHNQLDGKKKQPRLGSYDPKLGFYHKKRLFTYIDTLFLNRECFPPKKRISQMKIFIPRVISQLKYYRYIIDDISQIYDVSQNIIHIYEKLYSDILSIPAWKCRILAVTFTLSLQTLHAREVRPSFWIFMACNAWVCAVLVDPVPSKDMQTISIISQKLRIAQKK